MQLREKADGWSLELRDSAIQLIQIDFRLGLFFSDEADNAQLYIEQPCFLIGPNAEWQLVPEQSITLAPALPLFGAKILSLNVKKSGHLRLDFDKGYSLQVDPHNSYEAWQLGVGPSSKARSLSGKGRLLICSPGGTVSIFS